MKSLFKVRSAPSSGSAPTESELVLAVNIEDALRIFRAKRPNAMVFAVENAGSVLQEVP